MSLSSMSRPGKTVVAAPRTAMPRAAVVTLLFWMVRLFAVAPAPTVVVTAVIGAGVAPGVVDAPPPARNPKVVFSDPLIDVAVLMFLPVALPTRFRFLIVSLSAWLLPLVAKAIRTTWPRIVVLVAVFWIVKLRLLPGVFGLSPSIVT